MKRVVFACLAAALGSLPLDAQDLYDDTTLRELNLTFHQPDWWDQLEQNKQQENQDTWLLTLFQNSNSKCENFKNIFLFQMID